MEHQEADHTHGLVVPVEGDVRIIHSEHPVDFEYLLRHLDAGSAGVEGGSMIHFDISVDDRYGGRLYVLHHGPGPDNVTARRLLATMTNVHMLINGPAAFVGMDPEMLVTNLGTLGVLGS